jgi:SPP1 gp7 family putative phage head morphogenesis protein
MAVTPETLRLVDGMRVQIDTTVDATAADLIRAWAAAWDEVAGEWQAALADLVAGTTGGHWPTRGKVLRAERARRALEVTEAALDQVVAGSEARVLQAVPTLTVSAADWSARIVASQLPPLLPAGAAVAFNRVDPAAVTSIVERTTEQIHALHYPLQRDAVREMKRTLVRGVAVGDNPRRAAGIMLQRTQGVFNGGRNRALVIARTEMLSAHRAASREADRANADVVGGWQWIASLDRRTCPSCWAKHGTTYPVDEDGPNDHQQGRCTGIPVTKSWTELGFNIDEPPSVLADAEATFKGLPEADQLAIMGRARLDLLNGGQASWADLSRRRTTPGWRDSYVPTPVRDLQRAAN